MQEISRLLRRFRPDRAPDTRVEQAEEDFDIKSGRAYILLGGKPEEILTSCGACAAPFSGPCQSKCAYCGISRKVHYLDVTKTDVLSSIPEATLEKEASLILPETDEIVEIGPWSKVDSVIAREVSAEEGFRARCVVAQKIKIRPESYLGMVIVTENGQASFGDEVGIRTLITAKNTGPITFGNDCYVSEFLNGGSSYSCGEDFRLGKTRRITYSEFLKLTSNALAGRSFQET